MIKIRNRIIAATMLPLLVTGFSAQKALGQDAMVSYQSEGISYQTFYDQLSPYGQWVADPQYGNVWVPNVGPGFRPYATDGHWVMTDQGNMWVSDQPWAWAAYHYGRWTYNPYYGWVWIPGYEWAPAWVSWRSGGGYYGVYNYYERGDMGMYINRTTYVRYDDRDRGQGMRYYGPPREDIERQSGEPLHVYRISNAGSAGAGRVGGNEISIYRPPVNRATVTSARPANVIEGHDHPIGNRQEPMSANHDTYQPAFRQEHPQQQQFDEHRQQPPQRQQQFQQPQQRPEPQQQRPQPQQRPEPPQQQRGGTEQPQQRPQPPRQQPQQQPQQQRGSQQRGQQHGGQQQKPRQRQEQDHK